MYIFNILAVVRSNHPTFGFIQFDLNGPWKYSYPQKNELIEIAIALAIDGGGIGAISWQLDHLYSMYHSQWEDSRESTFSQ